MTDVPPPTDVRTDSPPPRAAAAVMDEALTWLSGFGPDLSNGMTSHAPMAAAALCALGRPDAVRPWIDAYRRLLLPRPPARERVDPVRWRDALAQEHRFADWSALFAAELAEAPWRAVLDRWVDRLAPGICAAATHGVIRVGHAARSLAEAETPPRRQELADALASWASTYQELPTATRAARRALPAAQAIARVALVPEAQRRFAGTITSALAALDDFPAFAPTIGLLDVSGDAGARVAELTEVFARVYLANARDVLTAIVFIHGVTSVAALGNILPHIADATARTALRYAWQASCALYAAFGSQPARVERLAAPREDPAALADLAVAHGDEHVIKFTEACLSQHARRPSPACLAAAHHALGVLPRA